MTTVVSLLTDVLRDRYVIRGWHTFKPGTDPARRLFTILRHAFYRTHRRSGETLSLDEPELESLSGTLYLREELERGGARWDEIPDLGPALDAAIAALPEDLRLLVLLGMLRGIATRKRQVRRVSRSEPCDPACTARDACSRSA